MFPPQVDGQVAVLCTGHMAVWRRAPTIIPQPVPTRMAARYGGQGGSAYGRFSNPATGRYGSTWQSWSPYGRSGSSSVTGANGTVHTQSGSNANGSAAEFNASNGAYGGSMHNAANGNNTSAVKATGARSYGQSKPSGSYGGSAQNYSRPSSTDFGLLNRTWVPAVAGEWMKSKISGRCAGR